MKTPRNSPTGRRNRLTWSLLAIAGLGALAIALPASADAADVDRTPTGAVTVAGTLVNLSTATRTLTVQTSGGRQVMLRTGSDSTLIRNGSPVRFSALALRDRVSVSFDRSSSTILALHASGPAITTTRGLLAAVATQARTLAVITAAGPRSFRVTATTLLTRNGVAASLQDLHRGDAVLVHARAGSNAALDVAADGAEIDEVAGTLTAIAGNDLTITPTGGTAVMVHVDATTKIALCNGGCHKATLAELATGMLAAAEFDPVSLIAHEVVARDAGNDDQAHVRGKITAVDATAGAVAIQAAGDDDRESEASHFPAPGTTVNLKIDATTRISLNGAPATLADLAIGQFAEAEYDTATMLASKIAAHVNDHPQPLRQVEGNVTAATASSLTIASEHGTPVTLTVDSTTKIFLRGHPATLADIQVGDHVHAAFNGTTLLAAILLIQRHEHPKTAEVEGSVTAISTTSITITPEHGSTPVTLSLDGSTLVLVDSRHEAHGTPADLHVGDRVEARYDTTTMLAKVIAVHSSGHGH